MSGLNRREALAASGLAATAALLAGVAPAFARQAASATGAEWDLTPLFPNDAAWEAERKRLLAAVPGLAAYKGTLGQGANQMATALVAMSDMSKAIGRLFTYASLKADEDVRIAENQERRSLARDLFVALGTATSWVTPEILSVGRPKVDQFIAANAVLKRRFWLMLDDALRGKDHTLSLEGEAIMAGASGPLSGPGEVRGVLAAADMPRPSVMLSDGRTVRLDDQGYTLTRDAPARADRKLVFDEFWKGYGAFRNSLGATYASHLRGAVFQARTRGYPSTLAATLDGGNIPDTVYRTMVAQTNEGLGELHRYFALRQRMLKLPDLAYYDIYPPLVSLDRKFSLDEMRALTIESAKPLGREYEGLLTKATAGRWMDPRPRPGKRSGAYVTSGAYDVHPYTLLNLGDDYGSLSTYAHEWGHMIHALLAQAAQPYELAGTPIFTAEIASTINEQLLVDYLVKRARTPQEKIFYLGQQLENIRGTYYRQAMFAEFELKAHEMAWAGEGLSGRAFEGVYLDLLKRYHGAGMTIDPAYASEWSYINHFYSSFYVYQYATCIAAGTWFAQGIIAGDTGRRDAFVTLLKAGGSNYPPVLLKAAGLDMASPDPYRALIATFSRTMDEIETLMA